MRPQNEEARRAKQIEIMENSFNCYAENGFSSVGIKAIAKACDCSVVHCICILKTSMTLSLSPLNTV